MGREVISQRRKERDQLIMGQGRRRSRVQPPKVRKSTLRYSWLLAGRGFRGSGDAGPQHLVVTRFQEYQDGNPLMPKYRKFTPEYRDEAVLMVIQTQRPIAQVARELGVNEGTLGTWVSKALLS
jgi:hypothetical protein